MLLWPPGGVGCHQALKEAKEALAAIRQHLTRPSLHPSVFPVNGLRLQCFYQLFKTFSCPPDFSQCRWPAVGPSLLCFALSAYPAGFIRGLAQLFLHMCLLCHGLWAVTVLWRSSLKVDYNKDQLHVRNIKLNHERKKMSLIYCNSFFSISVSFSGL